MRKTKILIILSAIALLGAACTPTTINNSSDGGIWVSQNNGETWEQRVNIYFDRVAKKTIGNLDIKKIIFSPKDERKIFLISEKNGLWVSWNSGYNWDLIFQNTAVNDIAIDPNNTRRVYAAVGSNIAISQDEGVHWRSTYISDDPSTIITGLILNPNNSNILYAATTKNTILISEDSGISWRIYTELKDIILTDMQFNPNQADANGIQRIIYAIVPGKGLAKSDDTGKNWELFDIAGEPKDYKLIPSGIVYASSTGLYRSLNFGKDWTSLPLISGKDNPSIESLAVNPKDPMEIFYGTQSTFYYSIDGGFNWIPRPLPTARSASELYIDPSSAHTLYMGVSRYKLKQ